jgi:hypothetical protein
MAEPEEVQAEIIEADDSIMRDDMGIPALAVTMPKPPEIVSNIDVITAQARILATHYEGMQFTEADTKQAKATAAALRRADKSINDCKINEKKKFMSSWDIFEAKVKDARAILATAIDGIAVQLAFYEERATQERYATLESMYADFAPALYAAVPFERIVDKTWLTKTGYIKAAAALDAKVMHLAQEYELLDSIAWLEPDDAKRTYLKLLDLTATKAADAALHEERERARELEIQRAAYKPPQPVQEQPIEKVPEIVDEVPENRPQARTYTIEAHGVSENDKIILVQYFKSHGIHGNVKEESR